MNYLAHLYFSDPDPLAWAGSLMGDFVKGPIGNNLPDQLSRHIKIHRSIDSYTRENAAFQCSRRRIDPRFRLGRSVMVDVFYDHLLASRWEQYHPQPLEVFSKLVYSGLYEVFDELSPGLQRILPHMAERNWLFSYRDERVVLRVLTRLEERLGHRIPLAEGYPELERWHQSFVTDFKEFMLDAGCFVTQLKVQI